MLANDDECGSAKAGRCSCRLVDQRLQLFDFAVADDETRTFLT